MTKIFSVLLLFSSATAMADCVSEVIDLKSRDWRTAATAPIFGRLQPQTESAKRRVTIHYTGVKKNPKQTILKKLNSLFWFSTQEKTEFKKALWGDIPYHYYIDMDGILAETRDPQFQPDTNTRYIPDGHITVVVEGDDTDNLSGAQKEKLFTLMERLQDRYQVMANSIGVHKDFASTSCPGGAVESAVREYVKLKKNYQPKECAGESEDVSGSMSKNVEP